MGEIKSVKVDNWGVFFLQKLQNFFNKTDFCDLTLQFRDNSQLKVHRLVLSACTDFFNVLEQTCELMDDALVMPAELQADVVVPIVNFMYTGTLEFELKMYSKLLRTAKEMNMTVLLKLLEAHKRTMETTRLAPGKVVNQMIKNKRVPINAAPKVVSSPQTVSSTQQPQQRLQTGQQSGMQLKRGIMRPMQDRNTYKPASNTLLRVPPKMQRGPIRFEEPTSQSETYESSFDSISYESKPLKEEPEECNERQTSTAWNRSSPFEQLRKGFNNNKRPAIATFTSPPAKKPNIEDVKEFSEQQRMRKQIAAEFGDDAEFDSIMDDEFHHDDDDEDLPIVNPTPSSSTVVKQQQQQQQQPQQQQQQAQHQQQLQQNQHSSIVIKQSPNEKPTIVVKDSSNSKMDHAKIISEVLRQYPHLVKSNKNIKLKIMPNVGGQSQKIIVKKETVDSMSSGIEQNNETEKPQILQQKVVQSIVKKPLRPSHSNTVKVENQVKAAAPTASKDSNAFSTTPNAAPQKRRIDSKTMHALIAQGAENTTGPWLCLRCGVNGRPISIPSYRGFRRHLINTHKETIDTALCEYCGWRSKNTRGLHYHMLIEHKVASLLYTFPECKECNKICLSDNDLQLHGEQYHPDSHKQQCIYCNKVFVKEMSLYTHMKTFHKKRAREDGVIDFSDEEIDDELEGKPTGHTNDDSKIKILSDIALPSTLLNLEEHPASIEEEEYANDSGPKFVNADGNEMVLTAEQREEIMSQLDQDHDGGVVMVLNESVFPPEEVGASEMKLKLETKENTDEYGDQNNEFLSASEVDLRGTEMATEENALESNKDDEEGVHESDNDDHERLDDDDHMEWAENLISAHDADDVDEYEEDKNDEEKDTDDERTEMKEDEAEKNDEKVSQTISKDENPDPKKAEDINLKLKMLTGDWTDDEIDEEDEEVEEKISEEHKQKNENQSMIPSIGDSEEKSKTIDTENKTQDEEGEGFDHENELNTSLIGDDELSQFSHSEKMEEEVETTKENPTEEKFETSADSEKFDDDLSETNVSKTNTTVVEKIKEKNSGEENTPRRNSAAKENDASNKGVVGPEESKDQSDSVEKTEENDDSIGDDLEKETSSKSKLLDEVKTEVDSSIKPEEEEESSKTSDKVKSLLNEWADDEDDL